MLVSTPFGITTILFSGANCLMKLAEILLTDMIISDFSIKVLKGRPIYLRVSNI